MKKYIALASLITTLVACDFLNSPVSPIHRNQPCESPKPETLQKEYSSRGIETTITDDGDIYKKNEFIVYFNKEIEIIIKSQLVNSKGKSELLESLQNEITDAISKVKEIQQPNTNNLVTYETCECASLMVVKINGEINAPTEIIIMNAIKGVSGVADAQPNIVGASDEYKLETIADGKQVSNVSPVQDSDIIVGVIDSGINFEKMLSSYPENIYYKPVTSASCPPVSNDHYGYDWANHKVTPTDSTGIGHGSNITLDILETYYAAKGNCKNLKILPVKAFNKYGAGSQYSVACGIFYAVNRGAKVINASLSFKVKNVNYVSALKKAIIYAQEHNTLIVTSAGNDNCSLNREYGNYPAVFNSTNDGINNIITVTSVIKNPSNATYYVPSYANRNNIYVHIAARSDTRNRMNLQLDEQQRNGTSYATGFVTGYAASLIPLNNTLNYITLRENILSGNYVIQNQQNLLPYCENGRMLNLGF